MREITSLNRVYSEYSDKLKTMGQEIQAIEELNQGLTVQSTNQKRLLRELEALLDRVRLPEDTLKTLLRAPVDSVDAISKLADACFSLSQCLSLELDPDLASMLAIRECRDEMEGARNSFTRRLVDYLAEVFKTMAEQKRRSKQKYLSCGLSEEAVSFMRHYETLLGTLKELDPKRHAEALGVPNYRLADA